MKNLSNKLFLGAASILIAMPLVAAEAREKDEEKAALIGQPVSLVVQPETIRLSGPRAMQQIVVTGRYGDGSERDLTPFCALSAEAADVVTIGPRRFPAARRRTAARRWSSRPGRARHACRSSSRTSTSRSRSASATSSSPR